ncbi:MAG TPA: tetratricopeptide repeat protein [Polyangium sp.]|nr:tetratricopeptide repeat protein [Polyangium sp.]
MTTGFTRKVFRTFFLTMALTICSPGAVPVVEAAPGSPKPAKDPVMEMFESANKLFGEKKYDAALLLFRKVHEQSQSPNARLMIGKCLLAQGQLAEAYNELSTTLREAAQRAETEAKYANTRDAAAAELAPLETKIAKIVITLVNAPTGARVLLAGVEVPSDKLGKPIAVLPGSVEVTAEGLAQGTTTRKEDLKGGESKVIVFESKIATPDKPPPSVDPVVPAEEMVGGGVRRAGYGIIGLGVVGMGLFAFGGIQSDAKFATLEKECGGTRCTDIKYADIVDSGKNMDLLANVGLGVGIAGLVAGTVMVIVGGPKPKPKTETSFILGPGQTMFQVRHAF